MSGYVNNKTRILSKWHRLFKKKHCTPSIDESKHWDNVIKFGMMSFSKEDLWNNAFFTECSKYDFDFHEHSELDIFICEKLSLPINCNRLVFINGQYSSKLSDTVISPWTLNVDRSSNRYKISNPIQPTMLLFLTECLSDSIVDIKLPEQSITEKPLYLLHISEGSNIYNQLITSSYYYNLEIGKDTNSCIIEHFVSMNDHSHFVGDRMIMSIGERSKLNHTKLIFENRSSYHISHQDIYLEKSANMNSNIFIIAGPKFTNHQVNSRIDYEQSFLSLNSLVILSDKDVGNIQTYLEHNNPNHSVSKQLHKIIASDYSTGIFNGLIKVNQNSIQTDGKMINNNLLLNKSASIFSIPKLEIYSDAVQCGHGATIGQIDSNHLFYLNSRGILKQDAFKMLIYAFSLEITETINNSLLRGFILKRIHQSLIRNIM